MSGTRVTCTQNNVQSQCLLEEVESLLGKQAIERVPQGQEGLGFYSTFFTVQKKGGGLRPILNLRPLNKFLKVQHFKMETLRSIIRAMEIGDWVAALDLKDAYLHIPIFPPHRKFLRFCIENQHFQFKAMPFGLATAPRVFTKVMAAVGGYLRMKGSTYFHVPGRLVTQKQGTNVTSVSSGFYTTPSDGSRTSSESREVSHMAISNDNVSWSRVQSTKGHCMPDRGSLPEPVPGNIYFIPGILCSSQIIPSNFGSDGFMHRLGTTWETTHAAHPVVSSMPLVSEKGQYFFTLFRSRIHFYHTYSGGLRGATFSREHVSTRYVHRKQYGQMPPIRVGVLIWALRIFQGPGPQHRHQSTSMF